MGDHVERRDVSASKMLRPIYCSYYAYFKITVIKPTEETNSFTKVWKFCVVEQNVQHYGLLLEGANSYLHQFGGQRMGISLAFTKRVLDFVLAIWKNGLLITRWAIQMYSLYKEWLIMSMKHMTI